MRNMVMLNQKSEGCIFMSHNAGLSVRHFITFHQILNCYTVWRNPHLLVCSLPETENFLPWGCGVFPPSQVLLKHVEYKQAEYVSCPGLFTLFVCLLLAAIGAIRLKLKPFPMPPLDWNFFTNAYIAIQNQTFSANARFAIMYQTFSPRARIAIKDKTVWGMPFFLQPTSEQTPVEVF